MEYLISEIALILIVLAFIVKVFKYIPNCAKILKGLIVYLPPDNEKISQALANPQKFVLNCGHIDENFSKNSPYYTDSEYLVVLGGFSGICVTFAVFLNYLVGFSLNTSFYLALMVFIFSIKGAYSQFKQSGFRNPDNWMGLFYSMTILCFSSMLLYLDHYEFLDFNFHFSLTLLSLQVTSILYKYFSIAFSINHLLFSIVFSLFLALMIFPYFKYLFRSTLNYYATKESPFNIEGVKAISPLYKYTFVMPVGITLLWIKVISNSCAQVVGEAVWEHFRVLAVVFYSFVRIYQLRTEVQVLLDQGKSLIYEIIRTKNKDERQEMELQCKVIGAYAWPLAHQSLSCSFLILSLCLLLLCKGGIMESYPKPLVFQTVEKINENYYDENEFIFDATAIVTPSMSVSYYQEIKNLEDQIKLQKLDKEPFIVAFEKIVQMQVIPRPFYRDFFEYTIWLYHFSTVLAIFLTLLYKRRFHKSQT